MNQASFFVSILLLLIRVARGVICTTSLSHHIQATTEVLLPGRATDTSGTTTCKRGVFGWTSNIIKTNEAPGAISSNGMLEQLSYVYWPKRAQFRSVGNITIIY